MEALITLLIKILEAMFAVGLVFSTTAIIFGTIDFVRTLLES